MAVETGQSELTCMLSVRERDWLLRSVASTGVILRPVIIQPDHPEDGSKQDPEHGSPEPVVEEPGADKGPRHLLSLAGKPRPCLGWPLTDSSLPIAIRQVLCLPHQRNRGGPDSVAALP